MPAWLDGQMKTPVTYLYLRPRISTSHLSHTSRQSVVRDKNRLHTYGAKEAMKKRPKNFYVVLRGRATGIFNSWDECKAQVHGFPHNAQKGYSTLKEAQDAWQQHLESQRKSQDDSPKAPKGTDIEGFSIPWSPSSRKPKRDVIRESTKTENDLPRLRLIAGLKRKFEEDDNTSHDEINADKILQCEKQKQSTRSEESDFKKILAATTSNVPPFETLINSKGSQDERPLSKRPILSDDEASRHLKLQRDLKTAPLDKEIKTDEPDTSAELEDLYGNFSELDDEVNLEVGFSQNLEPKKLTAEQKAVVKMAIQGDNIYLTGAAGTGKTLTLLQIIKSLKRKYENENESVETPKVRVQVVAPTGLAALPLNGLTTYSFAGWKPHSFKQPLGKLLAKTTRSRAKAISHLKVLIIEEISMVESQFLERLNILLMVVLENTKPFGGLQVIFLGDFYQLPPVKPFENCLACGAEMVGLLTRYCPCCKNGPKFKDGDKWAFKAKVWNDLKLRHVKLEQIHRQKDEKFKALLNKVRDGIPLSVIEWKDLVRPKVLPPAVFATRLMSKRCDVDSFNRTQLNLIKQPEVVWHAHDGVCPLIERFDDELRRDEIQAKCDEYLQSVSEYHRFPKDLTLKLGAKVVLLYNQDLKGGLVNGSQGTIVSFVNARSWPYEVVTGDHKEWRQGQLDAFTAKNTVRPVVRFTDGQTAMIIPVPSETLMGPEKDRYLVCRTQMPLMLGWALSIHKSQGMTMDYVEVSRKEIFESGQLYVALSRATTLNGLTVTGYSTRDDIGVDQEVVDFYKNTRWENLQDGLIE